MCSMTFLFPLSSLNLSRSAAASTLFLSGYPMKVPSKIFGTSSAVTNSTSIFSSVSSFNTILVLAYFMNSSNGLVSSSEGSALLRRIPPKLIMWNKSDIMISSGNLTFVLCRWSCSTSSSWSWLQLSRVAFQILLKINLHSPRQIYLPLTVYFSVFLSSVWSLHHSILISFQPSLLAPPGEPGHPPLPPAFAWFHIY